MGVFPFFLVTAHNHVLDDDKTLGGPNFGESKT